MSGKEELESFAKYSQLDVSQIDVLNVFDTPKFSTDVLMDITPLRGRSKRSKRFRT